MSLEINMDDFWQEELKKRSSYLGKIPSEDFDPEQYELFLTYASPEELDYDILKRDTLQKIMKHLGWD